MTTKKLIYLTHHNPFNVMSWSGTINFLYRALLEHNDVAQITCVHTTPIDRFAIFLRKLLWRIGLRFDPCETTAFALLQGAYLTCRMHFMADACIVAPAASVEIAYLKTRKPIIYISDATFRAIAPLYLGNSALLSNFEREFPHWLQAQKTKTEARALANASYCIFSSKWAADSATRDYGIPSDRVFFLPFGPNIPIDFLNGVGARNPITPNSEITILFVSADWTRKNGDKALQICQELIRRGVPTRLVTIGSTPEYAKQMKFVEDLGYLRKSDPKQLSQLCQAFNRAHFFLLPSIVDASPVVLTEAQAFGVPPVATDVCGIGTAITHKKTGLLLPSSASAEQFAVEIMPYILDSNLYNDLSKRCREWYLLNANWPNWAKLIMPLCS
jgi:glycosyltransferase involved in cell wall biosynthesis